MKSLDECVKTGIPLPFHGLQASGAIHVNHRRHFSAHFLPEAQGSLHVRGLLIVLEILLAVLVQDGGREGPEFLAEFYLPV